MPRTKLARWGAIVGLAVTIPLTAIMYLGNQLAQLPMAATDPFQSLTRVQFLGGLITRGIDVMVSVFSNLPGVSTDVAAKSFEQFMAILLFLVLGAVAGAVFALNKNRLNRSGGLTLGLIAWVVTLALEFLLRPAADLLVVALWLGVLYICWGIALAWTLERVLVPPPPIEHDPGRRQFLLQFGGTALALTVGAWGIGTLLGQRREPATSISLAAPSPVPTGAQAAATAESSSGVFVPVPGTRPEVTANKDFYRVDVDDILSPPRIDEKTWTLAVGGLVSTVMSISYADLLKLPPTTQDATLECISNPVGGDLISSTRWAGVKLRDVLTQAGLKDGVVEIRFSCADGYTESLPLDSAMDARTLLVYATNGEPLAAEHGFPLRLYTPNRYGMKNPKWITQIEAIDQPYSGFWEDRGWSKEAIIKTTSMIDVVAADQAQNGIIPVGGMAFSGARGISRVEVSVDGGPWQQATLKDPVSPLTWRLWRWDWQAPKGTHRLRVRAFDGQGEQQIEEVTDLHPSGASGYHSVSVTII